MLNLEDDMTYLQGCVCHAVLSFHESLQDCEVGEGSSQIFSELITLQKKGRHYGLETGSELEVMQFVFAKSFITALNADSLLSP